MATDNVPLPAAAGQAAADGVSYSGDANAYVQLMRLVDVSGAEGSKTVTVPVLHIDDNAASITVDAPAGTPVAVRLSDGTNAMATTAFPAGFIRTSDEPRQVFYDPFDAALDTTNRWNAATAAGGGVAGSVTAGALTLGSGTAANGYSHVGSQASISPTIPSWIGASFAISIESAVGNNALRFWGMGTVPGSPTTAAPLTDAYGFELTTAGVLKAVVYAAGVRTEVADLSASQPADALYHRYIVYYRTDRAYWYIDSLVTPVATSNFNTPTIQTLPVRLLSVAHSSGPAASRVISCTGLAVWDTGKNGTWINDGTYHWRRASISASGALKTALPLTIQPITPTISTSPAYSINDQVGGVMTFANVVAANASGGDVVHCTLSNRATTTPPLELWLFRNSPTMANSDNGAFDMTDANMEAAGFIDVIDFGAWYAMTSNGNARGTRGGFALSSKNALAFITGTSSTSIFGVMVTRGTFTGASTTDMIVTLTTQAR